MARELVIKNKCVVIEGYTVEDFTNAVNMFVNEYKPYEVQYGGVYLNEKGDRVYTAFARYRDRGK